MSSRDLLPISLQIPFVVVAILFSISACSELKVLVRLKDGQITQELLEADSERDIITLEFKQGDGALITFLADFKRNVKVLRALVLGEPERGQTQYQALCFITTLQHGDIIPSEAMARLRQKNPHVVRIAEEKRGMERMSMNVAVNLTLSWYLSSHIRNVCRDARDLILTRQQDVRLWLEKGVEGSVFQNLAGTGAGLQDCGSAPDAQQPCTCSYNLRLEWYPCALKYCRGHSPGSGPHRCGIRSCSKGYRFDFRTPHRQLCMWDEGS
ncbi:out at first protein homolog [Electrophorus electricus]|uniref:Out at first protein homolog n=1 Tax=Electrophorus electricus TaxID=8005 RepID=A0A4W4EDE1_ELEEL|nr:out at first protein homolog [Electrophorus electricus]